MTPKQRAERSAEAMWAGDQASKWVGMALLEVDEGSAALGLTIDAHHCNGFGIGHGGVTFALADSAFAFACNSRNRMTVAQHCMVSFLGPVREGDRLIARAEEVSQNGRSGIYDVRVANQNDEIIAEFRGFSRTVKGQLFDE